MFPPAFVLFFFFNDTATTEIYTLSLHDALPISEFLRTIIEKDSQELISTPFKHISATDIRSLHKFTPPSFISGNFLDPESYTTANTLHSIFHNSKWDALMEFDNDNSLGQFLIKIGRASCRERV